MAEGGGYNVSVRGSDAHFEIACTPCEDDGSNQEALKYCPECKEYLCAACTKCHKKFSATKKHNLLEKDFKQHEHGFDISESLEETGNKCGAHPDRDIEMYCHSHDMVYCALCIARDHRSCQDVFEIEEAVTRFSVQSNVVTDLTLENIVKDLIGIKQYKYKNIQTVKKEKNEIMDAKMESVVKKLIEIKQNKTENINTVEQEKDEILTKTQETKHKLIGHIEKLSEESTQKVDSANINLKQKLENERDDIADCISSVENCRRQLNSSVQFDKRKEFVKQKLQKGVLRTAERLLDKFSCNVSKKIIYKENHVLIDQIMTAASLMEVEENTCCVS